MLMRRLVSITILGAIALAPLAAQAQMRGGMGGGRVSGGFSRGPVAAPMGRGPMVGGGPVAARAPMAAPRGPAFAPRPMGAPVGVVRPGGARTFAPSGHV